MSEIIEKIAKNIVEKHDDEIAKQFTLNIARILKENGIQMWLSYKNIDNGIEEKDGCTVYKGTFSVALDRIDTSEHDEQIRADERSKAFKEFADLYREFCKAPSDESCLKEDIECEGMCIDCFEKWFKEKK